MYAPNMTHPGDNGHKILKKPFEIFEQLQIDCGFSAKSPES